MTQAPPAIFKIPTESPQPARKAARPAWRAKAARPAPGRVLANGTGRAATRGGGEVIELDYGITVYPAREEKGRWRAVWYEDGKRQQCEAGTGQKLAARLEKVTERLEADAPNMKLPGAALIAHYLDPDRLPVDERWSRKHADTQRRLCERFAAPVIAAVTCQDIKTDHTQKIVNAAPTPGEGNRVHRMISALVSAVLGVEAVRETAPHSPSPESPRSYSPLAPTPASTAFAPTAAGTPSPPRLRQGGADPAQIQAMLGRASIDTAALYFRTGSAENAVVVERVFDQ